MTMRMVTKYISFDGRDSECSISLMRQTIMLFYIIVAVPTLIITLNGQICHAQDYYSMCNRGFNYTKGSEFESNLNTVFSNLVQHTSKTGFNTSMYGHSPDQIYGLLQCRGDATAAQCYNCSREATTAVRQSCGNGFGGKIWFDSCYLRYENYSFIGQLSTHELYLYNLQKASKPDVFNATVKKLLSNLTAEAASGSKLYASGITSVDSSLKIYGLVQCFRDISISNCTTCLSKSINYILASVGGMVGARGLGESCNVRYETYSFFNSTALSPAPAEAPAITPAATTPPKQITPSANTTGQTNNSEKPSNKITIILASVLGGLLLARGFCTCH